MVFLVRFVDILFQALIFAILARVLLSWFRIAPYNPAVRFLNDITEPILAPLRRVIPPLGLLDITPLVALFLLSIVRDMLINALLGLAY